jgi:formate dehydrogenase subunit beta
MAESSGGSSWFQVPGEGMVDAARRLAAELLARGGFRAVLVPRRLKGGAGAPLALAASPDGLKDADPFAGVMPGNGGGAVAGATSVEPFPQPTAAFLRPCEARALVELVKLKQARIENLLVVGTD